MGTSMSTQCPSQCGYPNGSPNFTSMFPIQCRGFAKSCRSDREKNNKKKAEMRQNQGIRKNWEWRRRREGRGGSGPAVGDSAPHFLRTGFCGAPAAPGGPHVGQGRGPAAAANGQRRALTALVTSTTGTRPISGGRGGRGTPIPHPGGQRGARTPHAGERGAGRDSEAFCPLFII